MFESFISSPSSVALALNFLFAVGIFLYWLMKKSERQYVNFANLPSAYLIFFLFIFEDHVWAWFMYPVAFVVLFIFAKKFMDLDSAGKDVRFLTIKEFLSLSRKKKP